MTKTITINPNRRRNFKIRVFYPKKNKSQSFGSISSYLLYHGYNKTSSIQLKKLRMGKLLEHKGNYILKFSKNNALFRAKILHFESQKRLNEKREFLLMAKVHRDLATSKAILIFDKNFILKDIFIGNAVDLAKKKKIHYEVLKSKLCRFGQQRKQFYNPNSYRTKVYTEQYCYLSIYANIITGKK